MIESSFQFASELAQYLRTQDPALHACPGSPEKLQLIKDSNSAALLDLTPFVTEPVKPNAAGFFEHVHNASQLISAYNAAKTSHMFESDLEYVEKHISDYAQEFLQHILDSANSLTEHQVKLIVSFVKNLDVYCAVKAIESLLNSKADIATLEVAEKKGWTVHFDHLAIRCGSFYGGDAAQIARMLIKEHGYKPSQVKAETHYQFPDGWNAFPLYKMLENGQSLRLFVDQSDIEDKKQIIQHWNHIYGYTAHHLAMRASYKNNGQTHAVLLTDLMNALREHGVDIMQPTGEYTSGLLLQVFTKPELNKNIPVQYLTRLEDLGNNLQNSIKNGKLLELVSRREMPTEFAEKLFALYGMRFDINQPLHSAPIYTYFLPAQAAHVIKTSQAIA